MVRDKRPSEAGTKVIRKRWGKTREREEAGDPGREGGQRR